MSKNYSDKAPERKGRNPKQNNRHSHGNWHGTLGRKEKRQQAAVARERERSQRSNADQIALLDKGGHAAKRERARLNGRKGKRVS